MIFRGGDFVEQIVLANISVLRKVGTTNFFRLLKENHIKGIVGVNAKGSLTKHLVFTPMIGESSIDPSVITITKLLSSEELRCFINEEDSLLNNTKKYVRAELEKVDYRSKSTAALFKVEYATNPVGGPFSIDLSSYNVIEFSEGFARLDYDDMCEAINNLAVVVEELEPQPNLNLISNSELVYSEKYSYNFFRAIYDFVCKGIITVCGLSGAFMTYLQVEYDNKASQAVDPILVGSEDFFNIWKEQAKTTGKQGLRDEVYLTQASLTSQGVVFKGRFYTVPIKAYETLFADGNYISFNDAVCKLPYASVKSIITSGTRSTEEVQGF